MIELCVDAQTMIHDAQWCMLGLNKNIYNRKYLRIILLWDWIMSQDPSSSSYILVNASTSIVLKYKILILVHRSLILSHNGLSFPWDRSCDHHYFCSKENSYHNFILKKLVLKIIIYLLTIIVDFRTSSHHDKSLT